MMSRIVYLTAVILFSLFLSVSSRAAQSPLDGQWDGELVREGSEAKVTVIFKTTASGVEGTMTMPDVGMFRQPLSKITINSPKVHFEQDNIGGVFDGKIRNGRITGEMQVIGLSGTFYLSRGKVEPLPYKQEDVRFRNGDVTLAGTLTIPLTRGPHPAIVFTHGGGPDTRDLSRFYADLFARRGVASLIYDKRGVGQSAPELDWGRSSFDDLAGDALAGVSFLKSRKEITPERSAYMAPATAAGWCNTPPPVLKMSHSSSSSPAAASRVGNRKSIASRPRHAPKGFQRTKSKKPSPSCGKNLKWRKQVKVGNNSHLSLKNRAKKNGFVLWPHRVRWSVCRKHGTVNLNTTLTPTYRS
jgi:hypothetical protein